MEADSRLRFLTLLDEAAKSRLLIANHLLQVLWLGDGRALDLLIDILPGRDRDTAPWRFIQRFAFRFPFRPLLAPIYVAHVHANSQGIEALGLLNQIEFGKRVDRKIWQSPSYYRMRRHDPEFRNFMTAEIHRWNAGMKNGRSQLNEVLFAEGFNIEEVGSQVPCCLALPTLNRPTYADFGRGKNRISTRRSSAAAIRRSIATECPA